jgi:hypothetical protein
MKLCTQKKKKTKNENKTVHCEGGVVAKWLSSKYYNLG